MMTSEMQINRTSNPRVAGSNPAGRTSYFRELFSFPSLLDFFSSFYHPVLRYLFSPLYPQGLKPVLYCAAGKGCRLEGAVLNTYSIAILYSSASP